VLPIALGEATKTVPYLMDARKTYRFTLKFGEETASADAEGAVIATSSHLPEEGDLRAALPRFTGEILQVPPAYSALKIQGKRAYDLARAGEEVTLAPRRVLIERLELEARPDPARAVFLVRCGKGTYIRSLARDLARHLGSCGHVSALRRLEVGAFGEHNIISLEKLEQMVHSSSPGAFRGPETELLMPSQKWGLPLTAALDDIPAIRISEEGAWALRHGREAPLPEGAPERAEGALYQALCGDALVAVVERKPCSIAPVRVFQPAGA
jgi:tRNA pseudouridine55 synthase